MTRAQLKQLARIVIKVVAGGPTDVTRGQELIRLFDALIDSAALGTEIPTIPSSFTPITANQYGQHPAFTTQAGLNAYVLGIITTGLFITQPAAPTGALVDDVGNTFSHNLVGGFDSASDYELRTGSTAVYTVRNTAYVQNGRVYYPGLSAAYAIGEVSARVTASGARPAGGAVSNAQAFTGPAAPTVYTSMPQSYTVTQVDIDTKCGAGTTSFQAITRTNNTATGDTQPNANAAGLAAAKDEALAAIVCTVPPPNYNTEVNDSIREAAGIAFSPGSSTVRALFNAIPGANAAPISMVVTLGGGPASYFDMPGEYAGQGLSFFGADGQRYETTFINGSR
ncbi:hypothetical protein [Hymenobacter cellulosivorans]|uniref:Baseplate protein J-like domain-containing protein n=1 Tax=Hymenobacter cellulosivorans TaxID=2932249 RepID=A0ABY4F948_9BACT|nr:hypothetical protein [Hymenobacter cellulosivorans]UOQ53040.1 hypothetical protein MUN80_25300 [Hymenobacter cellulosivorans]